MFLDDTMVYQTNQLPLSFKIQTDSLQTSITGSLAKEHWVKRLWEEQRQQDLGGDVLREQGIG